ncbi:Ufe1p [Sporobolomyces koalae]|uniref:Ufe1p n=1 Tax=Sporobolomyces koalae TaxID=500713 RepID=UPI00317EB885
MTSTDRTREWKELVQTHERQTAPRQRHKFPSSSTSPNSDSPVDPWTRQAHQVATNLRSFDNFLVSIRRAYLDLGNASAAASSAAPVPARDFDPSKPGLEQWQGVKWLTDKERDEIDFAVKVALRKSVERVRDLEQLELVRVANEKRSASSIGSSSGISRLFSSSASPAVAAAASSESLTSHRSYITLYLNHLLQTVSDRQRKQQETRVQRQLDKTASLGGLGGGGAQGMHRLGEKLALDAQRDYHLGHSNRRSLDHKGKDKVVPSIYRPLDQNYPAYDEDEEDDDEGMLLGAEAGDPLSKELTQEQIQQFEAEESLLLKATQSDLEALKTAESSLLEISALQSQLAVHLSQQSELTDQLWAEAVEVSGRVQDGNQQLKKAKERGRDSRIWLLVFLFGSSFTLLFLDYYSS